MMMCLALLDVRLWRSYVGSGVLDALWACVQVVDGLFMRLFVYQTVQSGGSCADPWCFPREDVAWKGEKAVIAISYSMKKCGELL